MPVSCISYTSSCLRLLHLFSGVSKCQVRSSDASWSETRRSLRKDHRWETSSLLEREEKERLFNEHIEALTKKKKELFRQLLDETPTVQTHYLLFLFFFPSESKSCSLLCGGNANKIIILLPIDHTNLDMEGGEKGHQRGPKVYEVF